MNDRGGRMNVREDWWRDFFSGIALGLWRQAMSIEQTRVEADFIAKVIGVPAPARNT